MKNTIITMALVLSMVLSFQANACSAFMLKGKGYHFIGFNENWKTMPGMVVINKRGINKHNLSWDAITSATAVQGKNLDWKSKYGSVTFNLLGYDLPCYGINEKGLFIVELYLETTTPVTGDRPKMFWGQWIQYQLDNHASVQDVIKNLDKMPVIDWWPQATGSHFFVTDKQGNTAAIELLNGKYAVTTGVDMPLPLLCNGEYRKEAAAVSKYDFMGGSKKFNPEAFNTWDTRFTKAAWMLKTYNNEKTAPLDYSWQILNGINPGEWQTVIDVLNSRIYFKSNVGTEIKSVDIDKLNFSDTSQISYIDINSKESGDVTAKFEKLTPAINDRYIQEGFPVGYDNKDFPASKEFRIIRQRMEAYFKKTVPGA